MMTLREWRKWRDQAGVLLSLFDLVPEDRRGKAWRIYYAWRDFKITFPEARKRILALAGK